MVDAVAAKPLNLYQKLAKITGEVGVIKKGGTNKEQGYAFIEYGAVAGRLRELFASYGVVIVPRMQRPDQQERIEVTSKYGAKGYHVLIEFHFTVVNADDPRDKFTASWTGEAADFGDKATNKAATSALKHYLMRQFNISEKGDDPDESSPEIESVAPARSASPGPASSTRVASQKQLDLIKLLAHQKGKDAAWYTQVLMGINSSADASTVIDKLQALPDVEASDE